MGNIHNKPNVFVVESPFQLLNALEAARYLALANNHLVILQFPGYNEAAYAPLIRKEDWAVVMSVPWESEGGNNALEMLRGENVRKWYKRYLHWKRRRRFTRLSRSFGQAGNLLLGHYHAEHKSYLHHLANNLKHERLYLVDDGTSTLTINNHRKGIDIAANRQRDVTERVAGSIFMKMKAYLRRRYWDWHVEEAESVTFFTIYELVVRKGDHVVKNGYRHLKSVAGNPIQSNEVCFLGECLVEDNVMKEEPYLEHLRKVKDYFEGQQITYVPHPRESTLMVTKIADSLGFEIRRFGVPFEVAVVVRGYRPKVLASFNCSALESCSNILGGALKIISFHIASEHMLYWSEEATAIYEYFRSKNDPNFEVIPLEIGEPHLISPG